MSDSIWEDEGQQQLEEKEKEPEDARGEAADWNSEGKCRWWGKLPAVEKQNS